MKMVDKDIWDVLEVDELNIQKPSSVSMKQGGVSGALLVLCLEISGSLAFTISAN